MPNHLESPESRIARLENSRRDVERRIQRLESRLDWILGLLFLNFAAIIVNMIQSHW